MKKKDVEKTVSAEGCGLKDGFAPVITAKGVVGEESGLEVFRQGISEIPTSSIRCKFKKPHICRIYINKHIIASNKKNGAYDPPITLKTTKGVERVYEVVLHGKWTLGYNPDKPICSGASVWLEGYRENVEIVRG